MYKITHANIKEWAANYDGPLFDAILCDPPYELGFMGKSWDSSGIAFDKDMWADLFKLVKPGGHLLAFSGSRTYHRMAVAIEDAGFEIRDMIEWVYGSGFPKSLNIGKAVDKTNGQAVDWFGKWLREWRKENNINQKEVAKLFPSKTGGLTGCVANWELGLNMPTNEQFNLICKTFNLPFESLQEAEREFVGKHSTDMGGLGGERLGEKGGDITKGNSPYEGYGTALKPAHEPICLARKPIEGTVANNVLKHGTGGLNIDGTRVQSASNDPNHRGTRGFGRSSGGHKTSYIGGEKEVQLKEYEQHSGRFPANLIHDGSDEVEAVFPQTKNGGGNSTSKRETWLRQETEPTQYAGDKGSASRFFYTAKASKSERNAGLDELPDMLLAHSNQAKAELKRGNTDFAREVDTSSFNSVKMLKNHHPTVKPLSLTKYLANLIKPPTGGRLLVPFSGSGSEMIGALQAGWEYVEGVELTEEYIPIAEARLAHWIDHEKSWTPQT